MPPRPLPVRVDRRVLRTRDALLDALLSLMLERGYERLTVQHLLDRAGVSRATFYAHFDSKEDLLAASLERLRNALTEAGAGAASNGSRSPRFALAFFEHVGSHRRLYESTVVPEREVTVERHLRHMLRVLVREELRKRASGAERDGRLDLATQFVVSALWSTIVWWIEGGSPLPAAAVHEVFQGLTVPGINSVLG